MMSYKLMTHENKYGYGVNLLQFGPLGTLVHGFTLTYFPTEAECEKYVQELTEMTGWELEHL